MEKATKMSTLDGKISAMLKTNDKEIQVVLRGPRDKVRAEKLKLEGVAAGRPYLSDTINTTKTQDSKKESSKRPVTYQKRQPKVHPSNGHIPDLLLKLAKNPEEELEYEKTDVSNFRLCKYYLAHACTRKICHFVHIRAKNGPPIPLPENPVPRKRRRIDESK